MRWTLAVAVILSLGACATTGTSVQKSAGRSTAGVSSVEDPPALQLLTLPGQIQQAANRTVTADNLEALRTEIRAHTDRLEALLVEVGSPDRMSAHRVLRDEVIPALRTMIAAASPDEWTAHHHPLAAAMNHYLLAIETEVLGD